MEKLSKFQQLAKDLDDAKSNNLLDHEFTKYCVSKNPDIKPNTFGRILIPIADKCQNSDNVAKLVKYMKEKYGIKSIVQMVDVFRDQYVIDYSFDHDEPITK